MKSSGTRIVGSVGAILLLALAGSADFGQTQKSVEDIYQAALVMKEGRGDLEGAIKLFAKILADFPKERGIAGKAQLQIGLCYEKLGEAKAQEAYRKVIADFQDQPDAVKIARDRLHALTKPAPSATVPAAGMTLRQVDLPSGRISPDGRWIALDDFETNLSFYDTTTKTRREITHYQAGTRGFPYADIAEWAPSSLKIAFVVFDGEQDHSIHVMNIEGSDDRIVLKKRRPFRNTEFAGWTPDEESLILVVAVDAGSHSRRILGRVPLSTGEFLEIKTYEKCILTNPRLSPDGRFVAFSYRFQEPSGARPQIRILSVADAAETIVDEHPDGAWLQAWTPNGDALIFSSARSGTPALWLLPVRGGKAVSEPRMIKEFSTGIRAVGMAGDALYLRESQGSSCDVYAAQIDLETGKTLKEPERVEKDYPFTANPFWSPDGRLIAYFYQSTHRPAGARYDTLRIRNLASGQVRDIRSLSGYSRTGIPRWSADGKFLFVSGLRPRSEGGETWGLYRIDVNTEETILVREMPGGPSAWTRDGKYFYSSFWPRTPTASERICRVTRFDLDNGIETEIFVSEKGDMTRDLTLSDDDQWLCFTNYKSGGIRTYHLMPAEGGTARIVYRQERENPSFLGPRLFWDPHGKGVMLPVTRVDEAVDPPKMEPIEILYIPLETGAEIRRLDLKIENSNTDIGLRFSPDGKKAAFQAQQYGTSKSWVLENFLPSAKAEK